VEEVGGGLSACADCGACLIEEGRVGEGEEGEMIPGRLWD